jgi:hypothetical protein
VSGPLVVYVLASAYAWSAGESQGVGSVLLGLVLTVGGPVVGAALASRRLLATQVS